MDKLVIGLIAGALLLGIVLLERDDNSCAVPEAYKRGPEALSWLRGNRNESALASNRFLETRNAVRFVQGLYSAGAERVIVPEPAIDTQDDEIYSDTLVVKLPQDPAARERVWAICREELKREGFDTNGEVPDEILLWWD